MVKSSQAAIDLIVAEEVSSEAVYQAEYQHPTWPGGESGVTIGIGYDCGYASAATIAADWGAQLSAAMVKCLQDVAGVTGSPASSYAHELRGAVTVPFSAAMAIFMSRDMPKWEALVAKDLPNTDALSGDSFGALVSLAYNRGDGGFNSLNPRFSEMHAIRQLMALQQFAKIPDEFRAMKRLWPNVSGLRHRRDHEADLFQKGLVVA
jgi:GH24 family phage-related lysozyme (muramidase)